VRPEARVMRELAAVGLTLCAAAGAGAQRLAGTVSDGGVRVPGAIVMLVGTNGSVVGRVVSKEDGSFSVAAPAAGAYGVRVLRIGFRPTVAGPFDLAARTTTTRDIALSGRVRILPSVQVTDRGQCELHPDTNATAFRLWDEARTALLATVLTESEPLGVRLTRSDRTLDTDGRNVLSDTTSTSDGASRHPIVSLPPDSLARNGYATTDDRGGTTYWGPDANVLLSESFASSHCIRPELPPADTGSLAGVLGVAFEPAGPKRARVDVRGVLWIDRKTAELRSLDYAYANVTPVVERSRAGGHVEFLRLPDGTWAVSRWWIRSPMIETMISREPSIVPGSPPGERSSQRLIGIRESRGDLLEVRRAGTVWWERGRVSVAIRVTDSAGKPMRALVSLNDPSRSISTSDDGVVRFDRVLPGSGRVDIRSSALDSLGAPVTHTAIAVPDHPFEPIGVRVQDAQEFFSSRCGDVALEWNEGAVRGRLATGSRVEVSWEMPYARLGGGPPVVVREIRSGTADERGTYFVCGVPRGLPLGVSLIDSTRSDRTQPTPRRAQVPTTGFVAIVDFAP
jgi:carboxypeptidase family protein